MRVPDRNTLHDIILLSFVALHCIEWYCLVSIKQVLLVLHNIILRVLQCMGLQQNNPSVPGIA